MSVLDDGLAALDSHIESQDDVGTVETATETVAETTDEVATPETEETTADETAEAEPDTATEAAAEVKTDLILGKFKTQEDLEAAYANLESEYGRRSQEWGEVRKELEQIREQTAPAEPGPQQYDPESVSDHFAEHPTSILPTIQQAYANEDMNLVYLGIAALDDVDRPLAEGLRIEIAKRAAIAEMTPHIERNQQQDFNTSFTTAWANVKADHPDIDQYADQILQTAQADPEVLRGLQEGTPDSTQRVLTNLYKIAAFDAAKQDGATLTTAAATAAAEQAAATDAAKKEGFVATGAQRVESEKKNAGEQWLDDLNFDKHASKYYENT